MNGIFPEDQINTDDLYFVCYMIERISRQLKQPNKYVANTMDMIIGGIANDRVIITLDRYFTGEIWREFQECSQSA